MKVTIDLAENHTVLEFNENDASHEIEVTDNGVLAIIDDKKVSNRILRQLLILVSTLDDEMKKQKQH